MAEIDVPATRRRLEALKAELQAVEAAAAEARSTVELDQTRVGRLSRIDALQGQQMALATERRRKTEIARIDAALARLGAGDYGHCLKCGEPIGARRLELNPAVTLCVECARGGSR
jgi:DnaK suppressor protein